MLQLPQPAPHQQVCAGMLSETLVAWGWGCGNQVSWFLIFFPLASLRVFNFCLFLLCGMDQIGKLSLGSKLSILATRSALTLWIRSTLMVC